MAQETLKLVITADTQEAMNDIQQFANKMQGVRTSLGQMATQTSQATQTLGNFSRVAQDAPYGIIGIANNINPLVESFQRLQQTTGSTTGAIKGLLGALTGPAGIGLAIGVISSLLITFSKEIANFFKDPSDRLKEFRKELNELNADIYKIVGTAQATRSIGLNLVSVITGSGDKQQQEEALKQLKALYKNSKDIQDAKISNDKQYFTSLVNVAAMQEAAIGKEKNNQEQLNKLYSEQRRIEAERNQKLQKAEGLGAYFGFSKKEMVDTEKTNINTYYNKLLDPIKQKIVEAEMLNKQFVTNLTSFTTPDKKGGGAVDNSAMINYQKGIEALIRDYKALPHPKHQELVIERESLTNKQADSVAKKKATTEGMAWAQQDMYDLTKAQNQEQETFNNNLNLTKDIVGNLAPAFESVFSAMIMGEDVGKALEASFKQIVVQLISMVTQALLFKAILGALTGGTSAFGEAAAGAVGFGGGFGGFMGEFLLRGSDLVLATQRANTNLSYRR